jgi:hypothetical protein
VIAMPRRQKPSGKEKWTWDEINAGRKMSKTDKRWRRLAVSLGATKEPDGRIRPPSFEDNPNYWLIFGGFLMLFVLLWILSLAR